MGRYGGREARKKAQNVAEVIGVTSYCCKKVVGHYGHGYITAKVGGNYGTPEDFDCRPERKVFSDHCL